MDAAIAKRLDKGITRLFDAEGLSEFERIGFLEVMKFRLETAWVRRDRKAEGKKDDKERSGRWYW